MRTIWLTTLLLLGGCAAGQSPETTAASAIAAAESADAVALKRQLDREVPAMLARHDVPSAAAAYLSNGEIRWTANYGERAPGEPAGPDTLYNIASVTKAIVAETAMRLAAAGRIALHEPMASVYVDPDLTDEPRARAITPAMAMSHRTGFAENWRSEMPDGKLAISWQPGTRSAYSGENFDYLARFLERVEGADLQTLASEAVLRPASMSDTWFTPHPSWRGRVAMVRGRDGSLRLPDRSEQASGADDVHTTIGDFSLFLRSAIRAQGLTPAIERSRATIYDDQVAQACPPGVIPAELCPEHTGFGLGWMIYDSGKNRFLVHNGKDWGERAIALFEPEKRYGIAIFTSGANGRSVISEILALAVPDKKLNALVAAEARFDR